jgi:thiosulfate/3-mercaptopyruvate sulfurtransferase
MLSPLILATELLNSRSDKNVIILDASNEKDYLEQHLERAIYIDLNAQLSAIKEDAANGGRHPLPSFSNFIQIIGQLGITSQSHVVIYDRHNGANAAARLWWMLRAIGHSKVQVINGGYQEAVNCGYPTEKGKVNPPNTEVYTTTLKNWKLPTVLIKEIDSLIKTDDSVIIDVRDSYRYRGDSEPIDLVAGHIPTAINIPYSENLDEDGLFLSEEELKEKYQSFITKDTVVYCGSGVTACHTLLAIEYAGLTMPNLYVGSWSEWSRNKREIEEG